jgi:hypothetical protein
MHPKQDILNQSLPNLILGPCCQFLNTFWPVTFVRCILSLGKLTFVGISIERRFFLYPSWPYSIKKIPDLLGLGLNFAVVCAIGFLTNFRDILDFAVLDQNLIITDSRSLKFSKKLKFEVGWSRNMIFFISRNTKYWRKWF